MAPRPPPHRPTQHDKAEQSKAKFSRPKAIDFFSELKSATTPHLNKDASDDDDDDVDSEGDIEEDIDAPRVAQWIDDQDLEPQEQTEDASDSEAVTDDGQASPVGPSRTLRSLKDDLSALPLGTLRSAQRSLALAQALSGTELESSEDSASEDDHTSDDKHEEKPDQPSKSKNRLVKRTNKHAPVEMTSKRPVSRRRVVVDDKLPKARDPRFMHAAGRYNPSKFRQQYDFLSGLHSDELATLRGHVKRARKLVANSPSHLRAEREEEVKRLERAMKRAESAVNLDNRERVELQALQSTKQAENEKRKQGKGGWWMKESEKKQLLSKARLDAIASVGGKRAVKKAIEKKQKKVGQKEKKTRPFPRAGETERPDGKKRRPAGSVDSARGMKRRRIA